MLTSSRDIDQVALPCAVAVVDADAMFRTHLTRNLGQHAPVFSCTTIEALHEKVGAPSALVALFGPSYADGDGLAEVSGFVRERPEVSVVLIVEELSMQLLQQAIRAGVSDVITVPSDAAQLREAVDRAASHLSSEVVPLAPTFVPVAGEEVPAGARVITVFSTKGGAGKSIVATNLAVSLAQRSERPVCLLDCDLQFADDAVMLKLVPNHTIVDAVSSIARLDEPLLRSLLVRHDASGLLVLPGPTEPAFADQIGPEDVMRIVEVLREFCAYVVVDTPSHFTEVVIRMLEESDDILLVAGMDVPNIKNVKLGLQTLKLLNVPTSKVKLLLNRSNSKVKIEVPEIERALGVRTDFFVPSDIAVPQSVNKGVPVVLDNPKSGVARAFMQLSGTFAATPHARRVKR